MKAKKINFGAGQGNKSTLDKAYNRHVNNLRETLDEEKQERWETYNAIIQELINEGKIEIFTEIKYRVTDGEDPNDVILDIIEKNGDDINGLIWFLKRRIEEYQESDYIRRFFE